MCTTCHLSFNVLHVYQHNHNYGQCSSLHVGMIPWMAYRVLNILNPFPPPTRCTQCSWYSCLTPLLPSPFSSDDELFQWRYPTLIDTGHDIKGQISRYSTLNVHQIEMASGAYLSPSCCCDEKLHKSSANQTMRVFCTTLGNHHRMVWESSQFWVEHARRDAYVVCTA